MALAHAVWWELALLKIWNSSHEILENTTTYFKSGGKKKTWSIPCMNAEYPTPILFCCCGPAYPSFPSARQGWAQPLASVRSIRRSSKIILDHLNASPLWYTIVNSYKCPIRFAAWPWDPASGFGRRTSICLPAAITVLPVNFIWGQGLCLFLQALSFCLRHCLHFLTVTARHTS